MAFYAARRQPNRFPVHYTVYVGGGSQQPGSGIKFSNWLVAFGACMFFPFQCARSGFSGFQQINSNTSNRLVNVKIINCLLTLNPIIKARFHCGCSLLAQ